MPAEREMPPHRLARRVLDRLAEHPERRYVLGIAGPPGAGKSTLSVLLRDAFDMEVGGSAVQVVAPSGGSVARVVPVAGSAAQGAPVGGSAAGIAPVAGSAAEIAPMDGYHLSNARLRATGDLARKGEPDTFDVAGFVANLRRLRETPRGTPVPWPTFDRELDEPTPAGVVFADQFVAITEGNYLLLGADGWSAVRQELDECWYLDADRDVLAQRLLERHLRGGKSAAAARIKVMDSDLRNADLVHATRERADLVLRERDGHYFVVS
ncbi:nucleoside triphosphate hydrolase [Nocardia amikacinitolerans]|uniref:nucleoside triphosphate hydrolase n=1 Tax=Nocardia amikacinitolerans TaxID=756689 RepID=UPI0020A450DB|nr:nucleoside triphosphate hydrolase [Nocardia amikacinitolerans]